MSFASNASTRIGMFMLLRLLLLLWLLLSLRNYPGYIRLAFRSPWWGGSWRDDSTSC